MSSDDEPTRHDPPRPAEPGHAAPRQAVVKQPGRARRAKLTPAPGTDPSPELPIASRPAAVGGATRGAGDEGGVASVAPEVRGARGENDDRLKRERPPHW